MNISIHKLKVLSRASQGTLCFTADIHIEGKLAFMAHNDGRGGATRFHAAPEQMPKRPRGLPELSEDDTPDQSAKRQAYFEKCSEISKAAFAAIQAAEKYADGLPERPGFREGTTYKRTLDDLVHEMACRQHEHEATRQRVKRLLSKKCCWLHKTNHGVMLVMDRASHKHLPYTPELAKKMKSVPSWTAVVRVILNEVDLDKATQLVVETEEALEKAEGKKRAA